jgi:hypothetical protein
MLAGAALLCPIAYHMQAICFATIIMRRRHRFGFAL